MKIDKTMLIGELIQMDELIPSMLMGAGMHCLGCPASQGESLRGFCGEGFASEDLTMNYFDSNILVYCFEPEACRINIIKI